ncbi:Post-transcriptional regulator ComN [compost metagenome]
MAKEEFTEKHLNEAIETLCQSKAEEFRLIGYEHVTGSDIWACINQKYEKNGFPPLHQLVNDILSLKATQFMNYMTISAYRGSRFE